MGNVGNTEIKVDSEEIQKTVSRLKDIQTSLEICSQRKLLMDESEGKTAEQMNNMYNEILSVAKVMEELVAQTVTLIENGDKNFELADKRASGMFSGEK